MAQNKYKTLAISVPKEFVYMVQLNRPEKLNALNNVMWNEITDCFNTLGRHPECRAIILAGSGKSFCAGIDLFDMITLGQEVAEHEDVARKCNVLRHKIQAYQETCSSLEKCSKPVIAAVHGACIGAAIDLISAADIRYCSSNAWFQVKEVSIGMAADVGTLQRFPKIIGSDSLVRELVYTARKFLAPEALQIGFVNCVTDTPESLIEKSIELGETIAKKSPVAVQVSKISLVYSRDNSVQDGLNHIALYNQAMLQSEDFRNAATAEATKSDPPVFSKL